MPNGNGQGYAILCSAGTSSAVRKGMYSRVSGWFSYALSVLAGSDLPWGQRNMFSCSHLMGGTLSWLTASCHSFRETLGSSDGWADTLKWCSLIGWSPRTPVLSHTSNYLWVGLVGINHITQGPERICQRWAGRNLLGPPTTGTGQGPERGCLAGDFIIKGGVLWM